MTQQPPENTETHAQTPEAPSESVPTAFDPTEITGLDAVELAALARPEGAPPRLAKLDLGGDVADGAVCAVDDPECVTT